MFEPIRKKGRNKYVPPLMLDYMDVIKQEQGIKKDAHAMERVVDYARIGYEIKKMDAFGIINLPQRGRERKWKRNNY